MPGPTDSAHATTASAMTTAPTRPPASTAATRRRRAPRSSTSAPTTTAPANTNPSANDCLTSNAQPDSTPPATARPNAPLHARAPSARTVIHTAAATNAAAGSSAFTVCACQRVLEDSTTAATADHV